MNKVKDVRLNVPATWLLAIAILAATSLAILSSPPSTQAQCSMNASCSFVITSRVCRYSNYCCGQVSDPRGCEHESGPCVNDPNTTGVFELCFAYNCTCHNGTDGL
jgi:hypothetical protein